MLLPGKRVLTCRYSKIGANYRTLHRFVQSVVILTLKEIYTESIYIIGRRKEVLMLAFARLIFLILILFTVGCQSKTTHCVVVTVDERQLKVSESALPELMDLLSRGKLSQHEASKVTDMALTIQGDLDSPWSRAWGNWIEFARGQGAVSDGEYQRYAEQTNSKCNFRASRMHNDDTGRLGLGFELIHLGGRVGSSYSPYGLEISHKIMKLTVEGIPIIRFRGATGGKQSFTSDIGNGSGWCWFRTPDEIPGMETLKSGKYQATIILEEEIYESQRPDRILKRNRFELKDEFEYFRHLYFPKNTKKVGLIPFTRGLENDDCHASLAMTGFFMHRSCRGSGVYGQPHGFAHTV